jgi:eukaryotic-like serine/threonine-protein kinase
MRRQPMPAPTTTAELLALVSQSGLTDESRLRALVDQLTESAPLPADPRVFATELIRYGFTTYFQTEQLLQGRWKRFRLGSYIVLERLGTDTMGTFFLCEDTRMQRVVAIKTLPILMAENPHDLNRFYREARAMAACNHPNVVCDHDISQVENLHFIAMEYVDGASLYDLVRRGPLDPVRVAHYMAQAAHGLQHIHEKGLVHRNVKPRAIFLDRRGRIKVGGMNIVLFRHDDQYADAAIRGTPNYIAPEQALDSSRVDHRADIYSLGGTFYHLLTGKPPFTGASAEQKINWHQTREPSPIRALRPEVPEEMARVVERMMAKSPTSRYQSAVEVAEALAPWSRTAIPPPAAEELPTHCPRAQEAILRASRP